MHIYRDTPSILSAAASYPNAQLRHLLTLRIESLGEDLPCLLYVLVLQEGDTVAALFDRLNLPCPNRPDFYPQWEVIEAHSQWYELTFVLSDDGAGVVVFVPDTADAELLAMCRRYAVPSLTVPNLP